MNKDKSVIKIYDKIIDWFDNARTKDLSLERKYLNLIDAHLAEHSSILDVGCGTAEPLASYFIKNGHHLTGLDASEKMIACCKKRFPEQEWIVGNMADLQLNRQFDLVIAWHSFFHLPHKIHARTLSLFAAHLKNDGLLVFTTGTEKGEIYAENGGEQL